MTSLGSIEHADALCDSCKTYATYERACPYHEAFGEGLDEGEARAAVRIAELESELADLREVSTWVVPHAGTLIATAPGRLILHPCGGWGPPGGCCEEPATFATLAEGEAAIAKSKPWWMVEGWKEASGLPARRPTTPEMAFLARKESRISLARAWIGWMHGLGPLPTWARGYQEVMPIEDLPVAASSKGWAQCEGMMLALASKDGGGKSLRARGEADRILAGALTYAAIEAAIGPGGEGPCATQLSVPTLGVDLALQASDLSEAICGTGAKEADWRDRQTWRIALASILAENGVLVGPCGCGMPAWITPFRTHKRGRKPLSGHLCTRCQVLWRRKLVLESKRRRKPGAKG